jgi:G3E family GTPase
MRSQLRTADIVALTKLDLADPAESEHMRNVVRAERPTAVIVDAPFGSVSPSLLFPADPDRLPSTREPGQRRPAAERFEALSWTADMPVSLPRLKQAIGRLAPRLVRAKGFFETEEQPGRQFVFQLAGGRATLAPSGTNAPGAPRTRIVFVAEIGRLSNDEIAVVMNACIDVSS